MNVHIRQEEPADYPAVFKLIEEAFREEPMSDHTEQFLVERLRTSDAFVPELSLVAEAGGNIVGHILLTRIKIKNDRDELDSLALAPVSVLPAFQRQGIGSRLIEKAHGIAKGLGYSSVILIGHEDYYPRFGYQQASTFGIQLPFDAPEANCMAIELTDNGLAGVQGMVVYPPAFFG